MEFRMSDMPISDPKVGEIVARCLRTCGGAIDEALMESKDLMGETEWKIMQRGFGQILGSDMHDLWSVLVRHHPQYEIGFPAPGKGAQAP
jgi:hypothetical protein